MPPPSPPPWRVALGLGLAVATVALAMPAEVAPWGAMARGWFRGLPWMALPVVVGLLLLLAARLLPVVEPSPLAGQRDRTAIAVGLLLLLEPLLHLAVLGLCAWQPSLTGGEVVLPLRRAAGFDGALALRLALVVLLVPVAEEYFFRGRLLPWLAVHLGPASAVSITTLAFAAAHGDVAQAAIAIPIGLLLAVLRLRGAGLGTCILAHGAHNALFAIAGSGLVSAPWIGLAMAGAGASLLVLTWCYHLRPSPRRHLRFALGLTLGAAAIALIAVPYGTLRDQVWVRAAHHVVVHWRIPDQQLLVRIASQRRATPRVAALAEALRLRPCRNPLRQTCVLALLAPDLLPPGGGAADDVFEQLALMAETPHPGAGAVEVARRLGLAFPEAFSDVVLEYPRILQRWLPLPRERERAAAQIAATADFHSRSVLLSALERQFPGQVADVLLGLPCEAVTPCERRHLRRHYADADRRLAVLADSDPLRASAFGYVEASGPAE